MTSALAASRTTTPDAEVADRLISDPAFCIETFFHILNKDRVMVPFLLNPPQRKYYENLSHFDLILKARKEGFSSLIEAIFLHRCMFLENRRAVTMSHEMESTMRHFEKIRYYLKTMGLEDITFEFDMEKETGHQLTFKKTNSTYWIGTAGAKAFGRGDDITDLHLSEVAWYTNQEMLTGVLEACVPNAYRVMETTGNGMETFYRLWKEAEARDTGDKEIMSPWKRHFFAWFEDPTNVLPKPTESTYRPTSQEAQIMKAHTLSVEQMLWWRAKRAAMTDKALMPQEYPSSPDEAFLSSGRPAFDRQKLKLKREFAVKSPPLPGDQGDIEDDGAKIQFIPNAEGPLRIWKRPRPGRQYLISADVAEGVPGGNWSVGQVFDRASHEQVAVYRIRMNPGAWGRKLVELGRYYNNAVLAPENNNVGHGTIEAIKGEEYPHLLNTKELWGDDEAEKEGFPTTEKHRNQIITALRICVDNDDVYFHDPITISEMETFIQNEDTGKFEAQEGCEDDCVISAGIGVYCLNHLTVDETYRPEQRDRKDAWVSGVTTAVSRKSRTGYR